MQHRHPLVVEWQPHEGVKESRLLSLSVIADNPYYASEVSDDYPETPIEVRNSYTSMLHIF